MIRVLLREAILAVLALLVVSVACFAALDWTGRYDWTGTAPAAALAGVAPDRALGRELPVIWNSRVRDARARTLDDITGLANADTRAAARARIERRGTAALPTILARVTREPPPVRDQLLELLAGLSPALAAGGRPPAEPALALAYWDRFLALRALDFRMAYADRLVQRLVEYDSRNAAQQLTRLGTFALPAVFDVLESPIDSDGAVRLTALLADITGRPLRIQSDASVREAHDVLNAWRAWWAAEHLEYQTVSGLRRPLGHVQETRYGRWLGRVMIGEPGIARATGRPNALELRQRLPASVFVQGMGGLLATALVVAFGGGAALRKRALRIKLLDLVGALVPGLAAFGVAFGLLIQICAAPRPAGALLRITFARWPSLLAGVLLVTPLASAWLRRRHARLVLHGVRREAESWATDGLRPGVVQILRHGFRVGLASLFAPLALSALPLVVLSLLVEPLARVGGMAALTAASLRPLDAPWLLLAAVSLVPVWLAARWARSALVWALGGAHPASSPEAEQNAIAATSTLAPAEPDTARDVVVPPLTDAASPAPTPPSGGT